MRTQFCSHNFYRVLKVLVHHPPEFVLPALRFLNPVIRKGTVLNFREYILHTLTNVCVDDISGTALLTYDPLNLLCLAGVETIGGINWEDSGLTLTAASP